MVSEEKNIMALKQSYGFKFYVINHFIQCMDSAGFILFRKLCNIIFNRFIIVGLLKVPCLLFLYLLGNYLICHYCIAGLKSIRQKLIYATYRLINFSFFYNSLTGLIWWWIGRCFQFKVHPNISLTHHCQPVVTPLLNRMLLLKTQTENDSCVLS